MWRETGARLKAHATRRSRARCVACGCVSVATFLDTTRDARDAPGMAYTLAAKIEAEHRFREFLRKYGLPQPDEVEYGHACVRFIYHESKTCVVFDLEE